jgi:adenylosuccinate synthase
MQHTIVVGAQWGDEGKGKLVDILSERHDTVVRFNGGGNAGHTVIHNGHTYKFHYLPSGILHNKRCILGTGLVINPVDLKEEIESFAKENIQPQIFISARAHLILEHHKMLDSKKGSQKIGTTGRGIGPTYAGKASRTNLRMLDIIQGNAAFRIKKALNELKDYLLAEHLFSERDFDSYITKTSELLIKLGTYYKPMVTDTEVDVQKANAEGKTILFEGAQGALLDINYGTYPFVTSCSTTAGGAFVGGGATPSMNIKILGITKAYTTRVGEGPFPTELRDESGVQLRNVGKEFGTTTGRPRRVGHLDLFALKYAVQNGGINALALTKIDTLAKIETVKLCVGYEIQGKIIDYFPADSTTLKLINPIYQDIETPEDLTPEEWIKLRHKPKSALPKNIANYIRTIENYLGIPVEYLSHGPDREETIQYDI